MTGPFPFETRLHREALSVHRPHHASVADPATTNPEGVKAWHIWWQVDSDTTPTKYKAWLRNPGNTAWIFLNAWHLDETYADGQVPVADVDGYFLPGDAGGAESAGPIDGLGTGGFIPKWADSNTLEDSSLDENSTDITSIKPLYLPAGTTSVPSLRVPHGAAPSSPTNGDVWTTTAGIFVRINGVTVGPLSAGGGGITQAYAGYDTVGASQENMVARQWYCKQITLANDCELTNIEAHIDAGNGVDQVDCFWAAVFRDNAGEIGRVIQYEPAPTGSLLPDTVAGAGGTTPDWFGRAIGRWLTAGTYWIGVGAIEVTVGSLRIYYDTSGSDRIFTAGGDWVTGGGFTTITDSTRRYSIRANTIR